MRDCTIYVAKTKALFSFAVLCICFHICKSRFSHDAAHMGHIMRKSAICRCNQGTDDQLHYRMKADWCLGVCTISSFFIQNRKDLTGFCSCLGHFVSDLFETWKAGFHVMRSN